MAGTVTRTGPLRRKDARQLGPDGPSAPKATERWFSNDWESNDPRGSLVCAYWPSSCFTVPGADSKGFVAVRASDRAASVWGDARRFERDRRAPRPLDLVDEKGHWDDHRDSPGLGW
jgi:hypothetical protein